MFRSRANEKDRGAEAGVNREVSVPLVKTQDGKEFDPKAVQAQESKRRKRRIMKIAVYFMFGVIALGLFAMWLIHKDPVESLRFGADFIMTSKLRSLEVKNSQGDSVLYGEMGRALEATQYDRCWDNNSKTFEENCLHWRDTAELRVQRFTNNTSSCYRLQWDGLMPNKPAEDCYYLQRYNWFGYLTNATQPWPINDVTIENMDFYIEYPQEQSENLVPIWFGQQGVSIFLDSSFPFVFSWNVTDKRQFCIRSKLMTQEAGVPLTQLRYTICQSDSLKDVYSFTQQHREEQDIGFSHNKEHLLLSKPIHALSSRSNLQELLSQLRRNESQCSLLELHDEWESNFGDLELDPNYADQIQALFREAERLNCSPILPVSTFFSYKSPHFKEGVDRGYFVRDSQNIVTRMIRWRGQEGAALDVSNPKAEAWFKGHIGRLISEYKISALKLLHLSVPPDSTYYDRNMTYLEYTRKLYLDLATFSNVSLVLELATGFIPLPVYTPVRMNFYKQEDRYCLNTSIPFSLMLGLSGFPLLIADADRMADNSTTDEMFMRWLQIAIFFPMLEIPSIPILKNKTMQETLQWALSVRNEKILPNMTQLWKEQPDLPIIRPLWWVATDDLQALVINDQFMVGDHMMVAPFTCENEYKKNVYFPRGTWLRASTKQEYIGPNFYSITIKAANESVYFWKQGE
ncbi:myogenesis-regulating glycosidase-like isoform X2 [Biomphalaria glabrata]|uniref:Myogenesis-regulating glycosidase-like isoform X2 n=1 Tax=Biomphalaria glabrata TaxID=6526 RepID=A0A9W2ZF73_BIOGL|nr:myogenesis-regulating glycosidase-like isoform X2 [Biomphalaria glabrata]